MKIKELNKKLKELHDEYYEGSRAVAKELGISHQQVMNIAQTSKLNPLRPYRSKTDYFSRVEVDKLKEERSA